MKEPTTPAASASPQSTPFADLPTMSCAAAPMSIPNKIIPSSSMLRSYSLLAGSWSSARASGPVPQLGEVDVAVVRRDQGRKIDLGFAHHLVKVTHPGTARHLEK